MTRAHVLCITNQLLICCMLLTAITLFPSCTRGFKKGTYHTKHTHYRIVPPPKPWKSIRARTANLAWLHKDGSLLMTNSQCKPSDAPLQALANHLLIGMSDIQVVHKNSLQLSDRQALQLHINAKLDGVVRSLLILVLKKDGCVYDVVLVTAPQHVAKHQKTYEEIVASFDAANRVKALKKQAVQ
ncbi:MAG: hypothetical protein AAF320_05610 [Myxococcota bacterium]